MGSAILLMHCPDQEGLVASVTSFLHKHHGNILDLDEHVDRSHSVFFMRVEWDLSGFDIPREEISEQFQREVAHRRSMHHELYFSDDKLRLALFVSKMTHCLYDLLSRVQSGEWDVEVPLIISNHEEASSVARQFNIPFRHFDIHPSNKHECERTQIELLNEHKVDLVVLARYMQILTGEFVQTFPNRIINIHHSFLPAFPGSRPYHSAFDKGVKVIGATSHYAIQTLDAGPIIEQDVAHVSHKDNVADFIRKGRDLEKLVLSRAVWKHIQHKVLVYQNRTICFD